jgi:Rieske Fe-S protein
MVKWILGAVGISVAGGIGLFALFSSGEKKSREFPEEMLRKLVPDAPLHIPEASAWIHLKSDSSLVALEDRCTHLGCRQKWNPERNLFECPCHGSEFDLSGEVKRGPASRALAKFRVIVENGTVRLTSFTQKPS